MNRKTLACAFVVAVLAPLACRSGEPVADSGSSSAAVERAAETATPAAAGSSPAIPAVSVSYRDVMRAFIKSKADEFLEKLAESGDGADRATHEAGAILDLMERVDWAGFSAFKQDPDAVLAISHDVVRLAREFRAQAARGELAAVKAAADALLTRCFDCHIKYKK